MKKSKSFGEKVVGKRMLISALKLEESLAELLRAESRLLRKKAVEGASSEEIQRINRIIKYLLFSLTLNDDRIKTALDLMDNRKSEVDIGEK